MQYNNNDIICYCAEVTVKEIKDAIAQGATNINQIGDITEAGIACGVCIEELEELLEEYKK